VCCILLVDGSNSVHPIPTKKCLKGAPTFMFVGQALINEDLWNPEIVKFVEDLEIKNAILDHAGGAHEAPRTHLRGSRPIDAIFATKSGDIAAGGHAAFDEGVVDKRADHRCLCIDYIKMEDVFGHTMPGPTKFAGHRVKTKIRQHPTPSILSAAISLAEQDCHSVCSTSRHKNLPACCHSNHNRKRKPFPHAAAQRNRVSR
jgi:hypothetical protein